MLEGSVRIVNQLGLHARASAQLVRLAGNYKSRIILKNAIRNIEADSKSILSLLTLSASIGTQLNLKVEGEDEKLAFEAISELFSNGFGEL